MDARNSNGYPQPDYTYEAGDGSPPFNLDILGALRRGWLFVALGCLVGLAAAVAFIVSFPALYKSSARILIDMSVNRYLQSNKLVDEPTFHQAEIGSQIYILSSESVLAPVVRSLNLANDPEFVGPPKTDEGKIGELKKFIKQLMGWYVEPDRDVLLHPDALSERIAIDNLVQRLSAYREDVANVINVSFSSRDPNKAARIANAVADTYVDTVLQLKLNSTTLVSQWLQDRLRELGVQANEADQTLQNYKIDNNLVARVEQLSSLTDQLTSARIAVSEAKARLDHIRKMDSDGIATTVVFEASLNNNNNVKGAAPTAAMNNNNLGNLRGQFRELASKAKEIESRVGPDHIVVVKMREKMAEFKKAIQEEEQRIIGLYANEYEMAKARESAVAARLAQSMEEAESTSQAQIKMRELENSAATLRNLYHSFLQKFKELNTTQSETIPVQDARIITRASPELQKSYKKPAAVLAGGIIFGLLLGCGAAVAREWAADVFRTPKTVERVLNVHCVMLPTITPQLERSGGFWRRTISKPIQEFVFDAPYSRFAESLRNIKALIDAGRLSAAQRPHGAQIIGVVSSVAKEGKTTIAANLAALMTLSGARTLVVDADLHLRLLTAALAPHAAEGLIEALDNPSRLAALVSKRQRTGVDVLPCVLPKRLPIAAELLGSTKMEQLLTFGRECYDYIIIEIPPIMSVVDVKKIERFIDTFVLVVEWGQTKQSVALEALSDVDNLRERLAGVILNKVSRTAMRSIESYKGERYRRYYEE